MARPSLRNQIVEAALKVFVERGFQGCSVQDIAEAADVPKGSFYNHFASKEALGAHVVDLYGQGRGGVLGDKAIKPLVRLRRHFNALGRVLASAEYEHGCLIGTFSAEVSDRNPLIREHLLAVFKQWTAEIESAIRDGQDDGEIPSKLKASEIASFLINAYEGAILRSRVERSDDALKVFMKVTFTSILA
jgi:TetR/AcrR family transcriptional repressor of nem operon